MSVVEFGILGLYFLTLVILAIIGLPPLRDGLALLSSTRTRSGPAPPPAVLPRVTVQLPIYNEMYVLDRLLDSVAAIRYPKDRLEIQVLDDSTDETTAIASRAVERYRALGFDIHYLHRSDRTGFKAGALDKGLARATGEFVLIFDADFVAPPDILEQTLGHFADPRVGMVQARWGHINRDYSLLTQVQSIMLDGHFVLEHGARSRAGRFFNFNGTAGVWRRSVIEDAGGWQHDTLTEDLDLCYRAQMKGWRFVYLPDLVAPGGAAGRDERLQDAAAALGQGLGADRARSCCPGCPRVGAALAREGGGHLPPDRQPRLPADGAARRPDVPGDGDALQHGLAEMLMVDVPIFLAATASVCTFYALSQKEQFKDAWKGKLRYIPAVLGIGIGLSINNALAVIEGLFGKPSEFARTPKYGIEGASDTWKQKAYKGKSNWVPYVELLLAGYFTFTSIYALANGLVGTLPFIAIFQWGFLYTAGMSLAQSYDWLVPRQQEA